MRQLLLLPILFLFALTNAQTITTSPAFPTQDGAVTITLNTVGTDLEGYTGDVYAHTGLTVNGNRWQLVIGNWGDNNVQPKLNRLEDNLYEMVITPSINNFYGVTDGDVVTEICMVFRSDDGSQQTEDLFTNVYEPQLSVAIISPVDNPIVDYNSTINIEAAASYADNLKVYVDGELLEETTTETISTTWLVNDYGKHYIVAQASAGNESVYDSVSYYVKDEVVIAGLPAGVGNGINYIDDETVTLVLNAPEKDYVYLIGDFNNWDVSLTTEIDNSVPLQITATTWMMNKTADGNHFWITIENVEPQVEYAFQYFVDGEIVIADPYTEKVLDPWNDQYIPESVYPDLKAYPAGKTTEPVSVFQTAQEPFAWEVENFTPPAEDDMVVYEMLIRDFVETHSYATIADSLNYLKNLGVNVLELMPINEFEGNSSWGYNPSFYFAPDKYYGPKNELKNLIDECHKRGIAVVIDMVLNHSFGQSPFVRLYFENGKPAANNPWYNVDHNFQNPDAQWGYDFNHDSPYTRALVDSINSFWMTNYKVDGFRFDFTKGFSNTIYGVNDWGSAYDADRIANLKRMTDQIKAVNPNAYVIFEHLSENSEEKELANYGILLWGNLNHNYCEGSMGWTENGKSDISWISYQQRGWDNPQVVGYMESHDEERMMYKNLTWGKTNGDYQVTNLYTALNRVELSANFFFTIPGPKMIWQFGELGYDYTIDYNGRVGEKPIRWDYYDKGARKRVYDVFAALTKLKVEEPAFKTTDYDLNVYNGVKTIHLNHTDMNVVVMGNFEVTAQNIDPDFQETGWWYEYYSGDSINVTDVNASMTFAPGEYRLYTTKRLATPEINSSVTQTVAYNALSVYPNPASNVLYFGQNTSIQTVTIFNVYGQAVVQGVPTNQILDVSNLESGVYVIIAKDKNGTAFRSRFVKN